MKTYGSGGGVDQTQQRVDAVVVPVGFVEGILVVEGIESRTDERLHLRREMEAVDQVGGDDEGARVAGLPERGEGNRWHVGLYGLEQVERSQECHVLGEAVLQALDLQADEEIVADRTGLEDRGQLELVAQDPLPVVEQHEASGHLEPAVLTREDAGNEGPVGLPVQLCVVEPVPESQPSPEDALEIETEAVQVLGRGVEGRLVRPRARHRRQDGDPRTPRRGSRCRGAIRS